MAKKRKPKLTPEEIMARIIDHDQLKERKESVKQAVKEEESKIEPKKEIKKEFKWFEKPMTKDKFTIKKHNGAYYAQYEGWKENVWIGAYETEKDVEDVIKMYVKETKKNPINRNIKNVHSVILDI
jgi:hypothetical protein